jgi:hypothetical protein
MNVLSLPRDSLSQLWLLIDFLEFAGLKENPLELPWNWNSAKKKNSCC